LHGPLKKQLCPGLLQAPSRILRAMLEARQAGRNPVPVLAQKALGYFNSIQFRPR